MQRLWLSKFLFVPFVLSICVLPRIYCFVILSPLPGGLSGFSSTSLQSDKFNRDIEERSRQRAAGQGGGSMAAGAILGGLIGGPFGALFGAQIGANVGARNALSKAKKEEMERLGITQDMLDAAEDIGLALQQSMEGMDVTKASLQTHQSLARRIDRDMNELYDKAKEALAAGDEEKARTFLLKRTEEQDSLKNILKLCAEEKQRLQTMEDNVNALQKRAMEIEGLLQRTAGAKSRHNSSNVFSLPAEDPLLQKFRDLGID